jgi:hypothetical protein
LYGGIVVRNTRKVQQEEQSSSCPKPGDIARMRIERVV